MRGWGLKRRGFTIVELLIVIVIIAVLATIVIIGYGAVVGNANDGSVKSDLQKIDDAMKQYALDNGGIFPSDSSELQTLNLKLSPGAYNTSNKSNVYICLNPAQTTYAAIAMSTSGNRFVVNSEKGISQYAGAVTWDASNINGDATCASIDSSLIYSGVAALNDTFWSSWAGVPSSDPAVTNVAFDPSATSTSRYNAYGAAGTNAVVSSGGVSGNTFIRRTFSGTGMYGLYMGGTSAIKRPPISALSTYTGSGYVRASTSANIQITVEWYDPSSTMVGYDRGPIVTVGQNWTRLYVTSTAPATAATAAITFYNQSNWNNGDYEDLDDVMLSLGPTLYNFSDGNTPGWTWSGTANDSSSSGPTP